MDFSLSREQMDIKRAVAEFARGEFVQELAYECELNHRYPREIYKKAGELGFIGLDYPEELGGGNMGVLENVLVVEEFCKADSGLGMALHLGYLPAKLVKILGTPEQKKRVLTPVVRGDWISAVSFTESNHGSDLTRVETSLAEEDDCFVLNGSKLFTTNGAYASFTVVLAQEDGGMPLGQGMSTILVEMDPATWLGGKIEINEIPHKMGIKMTSSSELVFKDLKVPKKNIVGRRGQGLRNVLDFLDESRIEIAAQALGNAEGAFLRALNHARERRQFQQPIIDFQSQGHRLARMWTKIMSLKWLVYHAAWLCDHKRDSMSDSIPLFTSMVKYHVPETAKEIIDESIHIFGGYGYFMEQDVERRYRDNRIIEIYEGTIDVQLNNMVRLLKKVSMDYIGSTLI